MKLIVLILILTFSMVATSDLVRPSRSSDEELRWRTELTPKEQAVLASLPSRMSEMIDAEWRKDPNNGSEKHASEVVSLILKNDAGLRSACSGITERMLVGYYFIEEKWYHLGRHSFIHPRTVAWNINSKEAIMRSERLREVRQGRSRMARPTLNPVACWKCAGTGLDDGQICLLCEGWGKVEGPSVKQERQVCPVWRNPLVCQQCKGRGLENGQICLLCGGCGKIEGSKMEN